MRFVIYSILVFLTSGSISVWSAAPRPEPRSSVIAISPGGPQLWPQATMFYTIDPDVPSPQRILDAIQVWTSQTRLHIEPRSTQPDYVEFVRTTGADAVCEAVEGMVGGAQTIDLPDTCSTGMIVHEIGHAWGLAHEQNRTDRNAWATILYQNADKRHYRAFDQAPSLLRDIGYYDYDSIMHYPLGNFSVNGLGTIETVPPGIPIGQRTALSAEDIDSVERLYGFSRTQTTITTVPTGLPITVDGVPTQSPHSYDWEFGSTHTISVDSSFGDDPRYVFVRWSDAGNAGHPITASADRTVFCAQFQIMHKVSSGVGSGQGSVTLDPPSADAYYPQTQPVQLHATPSAGSRFLGWSGTNNVQASGYGLGAPDPVIEVFGVNPNFLANFSSGPAATIDSQPEGLRVIVDGVSYVTPVNFQWQPGSSHTLTAQNYSAGSNTVHYALSHWDDGSTANTRTVTATADSTIYTSTFVPSYLLTTTVVGGGSIALTPPSPDGYYAAGTSVQVTAQPGPGLSLRYWLGDLAGDALTAAVIMDQQRAVTAFFNSPISLHLVSAASRKANVQFDQTGTTIAPGEIVSVIGAFGPDHLVVADAGSGSFPFALAETQVFFGDTAAPILAVEQGRANVVVPWNLGLQGTTLVRVMQNGSLAGSLGVQIVGTAPALFTVGLTGQGAVAARNQDGSVNTPHNPAERDSVVQLFASGGGVWTRMLPDGEVAGHDRVAPAAPIYVRVGKLPAQIIYAGTAPRLVNGILQVNVRLPNDLLGGPAVPIQLIVGNHASPPGTTIAVK